MKKGIGLFFLLIFATPFYAFAQEGSLTVAADYKATKILDNLNGATLFTFDFMGNYILTQTQGQKTQIVKVTPGNTDQTVLLDHSTQPINGLSFHDGLVYVSLRGHVSVIKNGRLRDVVTGLPAMGDYGNSPVIFENNKMYFSVGTATNSGIVGPDNAWLTSQPSIHDLACRPLTLNQTAAESDNFLTKKKGSKATTGPFQPFNTNIYTDQTSASEKCNGAIFSANPDGSNLQLVAFGLHNPKGISFDSKRNLYTLDQAMENRGLRPVQNGKDSLFYIKDGLWYGWPDYNAGQSTGSSLIKNLPNAVPTPEAVFDQGHLSQFVVNQFASNSGLAVNDGIKVSKFDLNSGKLSDFITLPPNLKIQQIKFGPDNNFYVLAGDGKISQLWQIESTKKPAAVIGNTTSSSHPLPMAWSISLTVIAVGLLSAYLVYHNQQRDFEI
jgi:hypothetical protein